MRFESDGDNSDSLNKMRKPREGKGDLEKDNILFYTCFKIMTEHQSGIVKQIQNLQFGIWKKGQKC